MNSQQSPVLRLLIGGFAIGALGHIQGPVAMASELLAGGPGVTRAPADSVRPSVHEAETVDHGQSDRDKGPVAATPAPEEAQSTLEPASIDLGSEQSINHLRKLVAAMEPDQAASILEAIPVEDAARVVTGLPVSTAVAMLSSMSAEGSAELTAELARTPG